MLVLFWCSLLVKFELSGNGTSLRNTLSLFSSYLTLSLSISFSLTFSLFSSFALSYLSLSFFLLITEWKMRQSPAVLFKGPNLHWQHSEQIHASSKTVAEVHEGFSSSPLAAGLSAMHNLLFFQFLLYPSISLGISLLLPRFSTQSFFIASLQARSIVFPHTRNNSRVRLDCHRRKNGGNQVITSALRMNWRFPDDEGIRLAKVLSSQINLFSTDSQHVSPSCFPSCCFPIYISRFPWKIMS